MKVEDLVAQEAGLADAHVNDLGIANVLVSRS